MFAEILLGIVEKLRKIFLQKQIYFPRKAAET